jgi:uncharacterized membrane protein YccC
VLSPRLAGSVRVAVALGVVTLSAAALFGSGPATTAASFATIAVLYFLDYDGDLRERLGAYGVSTGVAVGGILVGALAHGSVVAVGIVAFLLGYAFAVARAYRGLVARSFVGAQLAFVLAVFTDRAVDVLPQIVGGWLYGSVLAVAAALLVFPRRHTGLLRRALSAWCRAGAALLRSMPEERDAARADLDARTADLRRLDSAHAIAGLWSRRTRALAGMQAQVELLDDVLRSDPEVARDPDPLAEAAAACLDRAADLVLPGAPDTALVPIAPARAADLAARVAALRGLDPRRESGALRHTADHVGVRVLSFAAESLQVLAAASQGRSHPDWPFAYAPRESVGDLLRRTTHRDSIWLRNGLRTGLAMAGASVIAMLLGVEHGVWVVMAVLTVIAVTFSPGGVSRRAAGTLAGVLAGIVVSGVVVELVHSWAVLAAIVIVLAGVAKWAAHSGGFLAQFSYTPFAVANAALLSWPAVHGLDTVRLEDIAIGLAVAFVATLLTFPFGIRRLVDRAWGRARLAAVAELDAAISAIRTGAPLSPVPARAQLETLAEHTDSVDAAYAGSIGLGGDAARITAQTRWLGLALLSRIGIGGLAREGRGPLAPELSAALGTVGTIATPGPVVDRLAGAPGIADADPRDVIATLWTGRAVEVLRATDPSPLSR